MPVRGVGPATSTVAVVSDDATRPAVTPPDAGTPTRVWLVASSTVLGLEMVRASGPLLDRAFAAGVVDAAVSAVVTYVAVGLVVGLGLLATGRRDGTPDGRTVLEAAALALVARLAAQAVQGEARFWVGLVAVALALGALAVAVSFVAGRPSGGRQAATGLLVGCGMSVGLQLLLGTWDALWRSDWTGWVVALVVAFAPLTAARTLAPLRGDPAAATGRPRRLWALGPFLALAAMVVANPAFAASQSGVALGTAGVFLIGAHATGAWLMLRPEPWRGAPRVVAAVLVVLATAAAFWLSGIAALVSVGVLVASVGIVLGGTLSTHRPAPPGVLRTAGASALLGLGVIGPLLLYMLDYDVPLPVDNAWVVVLAALVLALSGLRQRTPGVEPGQTNPERLPARVNSVRLLVIPSVVLGLAGVLVNGTHVDGPAVPDRAAADELTLVSWNLHYGVSPLTAVDLEGIATTIEQQQADVVTLQEVERGWVFGGGADMATWLAHRLGMTVQFAPAADRQFGNAVLARSGLTDVVVTELPYGAGPQGRSAITATVTTADGSPVRFTSVHLQHRESNTPTRLDQIDTLLAAVPVTGPSVLAGDLNAEPGWDEIARLEGAGWVSAVDTAGDPDALTSPSIDPQQRIDWVFGQQVAFTRAEVLTGRTESDHLPVVVGVTTQD